MPKTVLTVGVFDYFHYGHLQLFKNIKKKYPDCFLIVAVQKDEYVKVYKPDARILYAFEKRQEIIRELKCVDQSVPYDTVDEIVKKMEFDILVVGEDQNNESFIRAIEWCKNHNKEVVRLKRTPNISSSFLKENR